MAKVKWTNAFVFVKILINKDNNGLFAQGINASENMKILFSIKAMDDIKGGVERVIADVSGGLTERGHAVSLLSFDRVGGQSFYPLHKSIRRICLGIGAPKRKTGFIETIARMKAVRCAIVEEKPDVVVAFMHSMFIPVIIALLGTGIPVIASEHIVPQHYAGKKLEYFLLVLCGIMARRITVLSEKIKQLYPSILRARMVVVPNPVCKPDVYADPSSGNHGRKTILNVGRLTEQKNQKILIEAFAGLAGRFPDWDVRIVGEGVLQEDLQSQISGMGLGARVFLAGTTKNIETEYVRAHIFALPSLYESFGLVTAEAMSYGLPVVGFADCPGTNELIKEGENGLLAGRGDRKSVFADKLEELMRSPELRVRLGKNGIATAGRFAPEKIIDIWEVVIVEAAVTKIT